MGNASVHTEGGAQIPPASVDGPRAAGERAGAGGEQPPVAIAAGQGPAPEPEAPPGEKLRLISLRKPDNEVVFKSASIRMSIEATNENLRPGERVTVVPQEGNYTGPYTVALTEELATMLVEDGFCDLYDIDPESAKPSITFAVSWLDGAGRAMGDEVVNRVKEKRQERRYEKDMDERSRTIRFFFNGTPEMLVLMGNPRIDTIAQNICDRITSTESPQ